MTCIQAFIQAKSAADQQLANRLATATNDAERDAAVAEYEAAIQAARAAYLLCRNNSTGGGGA